MYQEYVEHKMALLDVSLRAVGLGDGGPSPVKFGFYDLVPFSRVNSSLRCE